MLAGGEDAEFAEAIVAALEEILNREGLRRHEEAKDGRPQTLRDELRIPVRPAQRLIDRFIDDAKLQEIA